MKQDIVKAATVAASNLAHDSAHIPVIRNEILKEIIPATSDMIDSKNVIYRLKCIRAALKLNNPNVVSDLIESLDRWVQELEAK